MKETTALFLDRDGVINERPGDGYVTRWADFHFLPGVLQALQLARSLFSRIIIVTNQQGVGKGLMTATMLNEIHRKMMAEIVEAGGRVDAIYYCTALAGSGHPGRKPAIGMAMQAKADFPDIEFAQSIMVGDTLRDLQFGRNAGMQTVWVDHDTEGEIEEQWFNYRVQSLLDWIQIRVENRE